MAQSPVWKVFNPKREYVASCKLAEDAAVLVGAYGSGARVSFARMVDVWIEGTESFSAAESYDRAGDVMRERRDAYLRKRGIIK